MITKPVFEIIDINLLDFEIASFRSYLKEMNVYLKNKSEEVDQSMLDFDEIHNKKEEIFEVTEKYLTFQEFRNILLSSFVISVHSYLELKLITFCKRFEKRFNSEIKIEDLKDQGFIRAKKYLDKVCKLNMPNEKIFEKVLVFYRIRNCLVHNGGKIREEDFNYIKRSNLGYEEDEFQSKNIILTFKYADNCLDTLEQYLRLLMNQNIKTKKSRSHVTATS